MLLCDVWLQPTTAPLTLATVFAGFRSRLTPKGQLLSQLALVNFSFFSTGLSKCISDAQIMFYCCTVYVLDSIAVHNCMKHEIDPRTLNTRLTARFIISHYYIHHVTQGISCISFRELPINMHSMCFFGCVIRPRFILLHPSTPCKGKAQHDACSY